MYEVYVWIYVVRQIWVSIWLPILGMYESHCLYTGMYECMHVYMCHKMNGTWLI